MSEDASIESEIVAPSTPSIKLNRGMKGTYGWEIKIVSLDVEELDKINKQMLERYGGMTE